MPFVGLRVGAWRALVLVLLTGLTAEPIEAPFFGDTAMPFTGLLGALITELMTVVLIGLEQTGLLEVVVVGLLAVAFIGLVQTGVACKGVLPLPLSLTSGWVTGIRFSFVAPSGVLNSARMVDPSTCMQ